MTRSAELKLDRSVSARRRSEWTDESPALADMQEGRCARLSACGRAGTSGAGSGRSSRRAASTVGHSMATRSRQAPSRMRRRRGEFRTARRRCSGRPRLVRVACASMGAVSDAGVAPAPPGVGPSLAGAPECVPGSVCAECSAGDERACLGARGNCAAGRQRCGDGSTWGVCSIQPRLADSCAPGDDADCDGVPNNPSGGCQSESDVRCGTTDVGECEFGLSTCTAGRLGACVGVVAPALRDCRSSADNDCNGVADSVDASCACAPESTRACGASACPGEQR